VLVDELGFSERDLHNLDITSVYAAFVEHAARQDFISRLDEED
jgi:adenosine deaminase